MVPPWKNTFFKSKQNTNQTDPFTTKVIRHKNVFNINHVLVRNINSNNRTISIINMTVALHVSASNGHFQGGG